MTLLMAVVDGVVVARDVAGKGWEGFFILSPSAQTEFFNR
jgi:hypothetical protein